MRRYIETRITERLHRTETAPEIIERLRLVKQRHPPLDDDVFMVFIMSRDRTDYRYQLAKSFTLTELNITLAGGEF